MICVLPLPLTAVSIFRRDPPPPIKDAEVILERSLKSTQAGWQAPHLAVKNSWRSNDWKKANSWEWRKDFYYCVHRFLSLYSQISNVLAKLLEIFVMELFQAECKRRSFDPVWKVWFTSWWAVLFFWAADRCYKNTKSHLNQTDLKGVRVPRFEILGASRSRVPRSNLSLRIRKDSTLDP